MKILNVTYENYLPKQGLEESQAKIWLDAQHRLGDSVFPLPKLEEVIQQVKERHETEKPEAEGIRYAYSEERDLLAYVQSRDAPYFNATEVSFPWATEECPRKVQDRLFSDMVKYIINRNKERGDNNRILAGGGYISKWENEINFLKSHGFEVVTTFVTYRYGSSSFQPPEKEKFVIRKGVLTNSDDLASLMEIGRVDETALAAFDSEDSMKGYYERIKDNPLKVVLIYEADVIVAAGAVRIDENRGPSIQFTFYRPGHELAWKHLMVKLVEIGFQKTNRYLLATYEDGETKEFGMVKELEKDGFVEFLTKSYQFGLSKESKYFNSA